jgi:hypothetical protein
MASGFRQWQAKFKAAELDQTAAERRAATAEREVLALKRQLDEAAADTEEAVQGALAEAHEAFDAEVGRRRVPPRAVRRPLCRPLFGLVCGVHDFKEAGIRKTRVLSILQGLPPLKALSVSAISL